MQQPQTTCSNPLCIQFRTQHRIITQKRNELEKELETLRNQYASHVVQSIPVAEAPDETGVRLPNGELMTVEKFMTRTAMMNQCRESLQVSEKRARQFGEENVKLRLERDTLYATMRKFEDTLQGFERARHYDVFTDENHRKTLADNAMLIEENEQLSSNERELKEENRILRRRIHALMARRKKIVTEPVAERPSSDEESGLVCNAAFKKRSRAQHGRRVIESDEDERQSD